MQKSEKQVKYLPYTVQGVTDESHSWVINCRSPSDGLHAVVSNISNLIYCVKVHVTHKDRNVQDIT